MQTTVQQCMTWLGFWSLFQQMLASLLLESCVLSGGAADIAPKMSSATFSGPIFLLFSTTCIRFWLENTILWNNSYLCIALVQWLGFVHNWNVVWNDCLWWARPTDVLLFLLGSEIVNAVPCSSLRDVVCTMICMRAFQLSMAMIQRAQVRISMVCIPVHVCVRVFVPLAIGHPVLESMLEAKEMDYFWSRDACLPGVVLWQNRLPLWLSSRAVLAELGSGQQTWLKWTTWCSSVFCGNWHMLIVRALKKFRISWVSLSELWKTNAQVCARHCSLQLS